MNYSFADCPYPGSLDAIEHLSTLGPMVILSDGDVIFQPREVERSGLCEALEGRALVYIHTEEQLDNVEKRHPARHCVLVDNELRILTAARKVWESRLGGMGRNMQLDVLDHGHSTAGLDTDTAKVKALVDEAKGQEVGATTDPKAPVAMLRKMRTIMPLVPAGAPVDTASRCGTGATSIVRRSPWTTGAGTTCHSLCGPAHGPRRPA